MRRDLLLDRQPGDLVPEAQRGRIAREQPAADEVVHGAGRSAGGRGQERRIDARADQRRALGGGAGVLSHKKIKGPGQVFWGRPARPLRQYLRDLARLSRS